MPQIRMLKLDSFPLEELRQMVDLCNRMTDDNNAKYGNSTAWLNDAAAEADIIIAIWRNPRVELGWEAGFLKGGSPSPEVARARSEGRQTMKAIHIRLADLDTAINVGLKWGDLVDTKATRNPPANLPPILQAAMRWSGKAS